MYNNNRSNRPTGRNTSRNRQVRQYNNSAILNMPVAPYNFVPLNNIVFYPPVYEYINNLTEKEDIQNGYKTFLQEKGKYSGFFDVDIENITPVYIGGENKKFFSIGGKYCIPGSSLRGCLKNIFKIITNGAMRVKSDKNSEADITDKLLYFRNMAGKGTDPLKLLYKENFPKKFKWVEIKGETKKIQISAANVGFLVRKDKNYFICKANLDRKKGNDEVVNPKEPYIKWNSNSADIFTGEMRGKKHFYEIYEPVWSERYSIPEKVVQSYKEDENRNGLNLLDEEKIKKGLENFTLLPDDEKFDYVVPCFFVEKDGIVKHFGAGPFYRIPYTKSIGEHVPSRLKEEKLDFADAIFGNKEYWGSRVNIEDCYLENQKDVFEAKACSKILLSPNPTSFQLYLEPIDKNKAGHWDDDVDIRGYKFYWHKSADWRNQKEIDNEKLKNFIAPIKANNHFKGRVRFENLDAVELGALAYVFALAEEKNICYKIGKGKPIGMGSIKVQGKLYLRGTDYYRQLFVKEHNAFAEDIIESNKEEFIVQFNDYIQAQISKKSWDSYQKRLEQLRSILNVEYMQGKNKDKWNNELTRYMEIDNPSDRNIVTSRTPLPTINEVVQALKK